MHTAAGPRAFGLTAWRAAERIGDAAFGSTVNPLRHLGAIGFFAFWLLAASGVAPCGDPIRALYSPGVRTRFGRPTVVR